MANVSCATRTAFLLAGLPAILVAQSATTAALTGMVRDESGQAVAGATVRVESDHLIGGEKAVVTSVNGTFRYPALPPGSYRITVEAKGYPTHQERQRLELGRTSTVQVKLKGISAQAVVEVVDALGNADMAPAGVTQNYRMDDLQDLPIGRDLSAIANLTPGVNAGVAWGGDRTNSNAYMINGVNVSDPSAGGQWIQVNPDWFDEVQIGGLGASAEWGGFSGGYFNGLVKKGGNTFKGDLTTYYQSQDWSAVRQLPDPNVPGAALRVQADRFSDVALNLGGAVVKDRLWYFVSLQSTRQEHAPVGAPSSEQVTLPRFLANLTWQARANATLSLFLDLDDKSTDHRGSSRIRMPEATTRQVSPNRTFGLSWLQTLTSSLVFTLETSGYTGKDDRRAYAGETPPLYVDGGVPAGSAAYGGRWELGNAYQTQRNLRSSIGVKATLDWFRTGVLGAQDSHAIKLGLEREQASDEEVMRFPGNVSYNAYADGPDVVTDFVQTDGGLNLRVRQDRTTVFLLDTWSVNSRLTVRPGLRFEQNQGRAYGGSSVWNTRTVSPRLGFTLNLKQDASSVLKAHWGRYFDGLKAAYYDRAVPGAYPVENRYYWGSGSYFDPAVITDLTRPQDIAHDSVPYTTRTNASAIDPNIRQPYQDEFMLAFEQRAGKNWTFTVSALQRQAKQMLVRTDLAALPGTTVSAVNPLNGQAMVFPKFPGTHQFYLTNSADAKRKYTLYSLSAEGKLSAKWTLNASYSHADLSGNVSRSNGYDQQYQHPVFDFNSSGQLPGFNDHEFKLRSSYQTPWNLRLGFDYTYLSGEHYTRTYQFTKLNSAKEKADAFIEGRGASSYGSQQNLNLRITQRFQVSRQVALDLFADVYNLLNRYAVTAVGTRANSSLYLQPTAIPDPRTARVGARLTF